MLRCVALIALSDKSNRRACHMFHILKHKIIDLSYAQSDTLFPPGKLYFARFPKTLNQFENNYLQVIQIDISPRKCLNTSRRKVSGFV